MISGLALAALLAASNLPCQELQARAADLLLPGEGATEDARTELAKGRLKAVCSWDGQEAEGAAPDRARLAAILDRPEFSTARNRNSHLLERLFARFSEWVRSLLETRGAQRFSEVSRFLVLALALAVVAGGTLRLLGRRGARRKVSSALPSSAPGKLSLEDPAVHLAQARRALASDPREAIRQGLLGLLSVLERSRLARPDRAKTNQELATELPERGAPPELSGEVERLLAWYDRAFYSLEPVPGAAAQGFLEQVSQLHARLSKAAP